MGPLRILYKKLIGFWNKRDAKGMAKLFSEKGNIVGFDGSQINGGKNIEKELSAIFKDHQTAPFVTKIREVRLISPDTALLRAIAGMVPVGQSGINPKLNAIQTLVASKKRGGWIIELFQNTPAAFHGRPQLSKSLTKELREILKK